MALRTIVQDGDPILKKVCRPVTKFDDRLGTLLDDMKETLIAANGLGLAGPQVGIGSTELMAADTVERAAWMTVTCPRRSPLTTSTSSSSSSTQRSLS